MPELESLLLVLLLVYSAECLVWVPLGGVGFRTAWKKSFKLLQPSALAGNQHGGLVLAHPWPPLGFVFVARQFPLSLSSVGLFSFVASSPHRDRRATQPAVYWRFDEVKEIRLEGKQLLVGDKLLLKAASLMEAQRVAAIVKRLAGLEPEQRQKAIEEQIGQAFDPEAVDAEMKRFGVRGLRLRRLGNVLLLFLFVAAPALIWNFGFRATAWPLVGLLLAQTTCLALLFRRAHMQLFPSGSDERFVPFMLILLSPASAVRAHDFLARHVLASFHPLAVAHVLCAREEFKAYARQIVTDLRHPMHPLGAGDAAEAAQTEEWFRKATLRAAEQLAQRSGLSLEELSARPDTVETGVQSYCPRCGVQFLHREACCSDCGGRPALAYP